MTGCVRLAGPVGKTARLQCLARIDSCQFAPRGMGCGKAGLQGKPVDYPLGGSATTGIEAAPQTGHEVDCELHVRSLSAGLVKIG